MSHDPGIDDLMEQIECATITRDNMEGRPNGWLVKYAAIKAERDELLSQLKQVEALSEIRLAQRDELLVALNDAATSLETIAIRSYGESSCLDSKQQMRGFAGSRAVVARKDIASAKELK